MTNAHLGQRPNSHRTRRHQLRPHGRSGGVCRDDGNGPTKGRRNNTPPQAAASPQLYNLTPSALILVADALPRSNWAPLTYPTDIPVWPNGNRGPQDRVRGTRVPPSPSLLEFLVSAMVVQGYTGVTAHVGLWCMAKEKSPPGVCALYELISVHMAAMAHPNPAGKRCAHSRSSRRSKGKDCEIIGFGKTPRLAELPPLEL